MKSFILPLTAFAVLSCNILELGESGKKTLPEGGRRGPATADSTDVPDPWLGYPFLDSDTTLYVSAISRDTAGRTLYLLKNWKTALSLPVGEEFCISEDPDYSHILGGHLYTEFPHSGGTIVCRDGKEVLRISERKFLIGILEKGDDLYLLGSGPSGKGFTLWKNGSALLSRDSGTVFGDLLDPSYAPTGALYADSGHYWFAFCLDGGRYFVVKDGREEEVTFPDRASPYQDIKVRSGRVEAASWRSAYANWEDARLWHDGSVFVQCGDVELVPGFVLSGARRFDRSNIELLTMPGATIYYRSGLPLHGICQDGDGGLYVLECGTEEEDALLEGEYGYFRACQGLLLEDGFMLGLNPRKEAPFILYQGKKWPVGWLNADICGLEVEISPSS